MQEKMQKVKEKPEKKPNALVLKLKGFFETIKGKLAGFGKKKPAPIPMGAEAAVQEEPVQEEIPELYLPETTEDLVWLLKKMPESVLTAKEKVLLAKCMSFSDKRVRDIMTPKEQVVFVHENDFMGPLTLDRLYKSGLEHFPVVDIRGGVAGVLHTSSLNSLEIRETDRASSYVDKTVYYMRDNYTLNEALAAFLRTNSYLFIVINQGAQVVGMVTFSAMVEALVGEAPKDDFGQDADLMAVAKRGFGMNSYFRPEFRPGVKTDATTHGV